MSSKPTKILQFGVTGQLAHEIAKIATCRPNVTLHTLDRSKADFRDPESVAHAVRAAQHVDIVINATAFTAVEQAESEEDLAYLINATSVGALAIACQERRVPLIHVSTDYIFDGNKSAPYVETDAANPVSAYGRTKLAGEDAVRAAMARHVIIRTSWVYSARGTNFVRTMLRLGRERDELRVVYNQYGAPTSARALACAVVDIAERAAAGGRNECFGTFHYTNAGETTWKSFADTIFRETQQWAVPRRPQVVGISASEYPSAARRPTNSRLDCSKIAAAYQVKRPFWTESLALVLDEIRDAEEGKDQ